MNKKASKLIQKSALELVKLVDYANVDWDEVYLMYHEEEIHQGGTETFRKDRKVKFLNFDFEDKKANKISSKIWKNLSSIFEEIEKVKGEKPCDCVLKINSDYDFNIKFGYGDMKGMSIRLLDLGTEKSFYDLTDIDMPKSIGKAQAKGL